MNAISLKLEEFTLEETATIVRRERISRNAYINEAIKAYNALHQRRELGKKLANESAMVSATSLETLKELEQIVDLHEN
ncbi:MAG: hypothetical protein JSR44_00190 [Spirochaetes bacterium]|nr:hypothetical protein [Spirochaetota bacterium]